MDDRKHTLTATFHFDRFANMFGLTRRLSRRDSKPCCSGEFAPYCIPVAGECFASRTAS